MHLGLDAVFEAMAQRLGETQQTLESHLSSGKPLSEIAKEKGVTEEELCHTAVSAMKPRLDEAVKSGKMTPKMAEAVLYRMEHGQNAPRAA